MIQSTSKAQLFLSTLLQERRKRNQKYSLRAFARDLKVPASRLSEILNGKRQISEKMKVHFVENLDLSPQDAQANFNLRVRDPKVDSDIKYSFAQVEEDQLSVIVDWYHFAILNLMDTADFEHTPQWIGQRLGIDISLAEAGLKRLQRVGLLVYENSVYKKTKNNLATTDQLTSRALKIAHKQVLEGSITALEKTPVSLRDISSISMAIDLININLAKAEIKRFRRRMARLMEDGERTEVFNLNIQFVPVTRVRALE